jgi:multiple sugar transport system substrate-binding protein
MKNPCLLSALACLLTITLSGCSKSIAVPTPEPTIITFAHPSLDESYYQSLVGEFNKTRPHIAIELYPIRRSSDFVDLENIDVFIGSPYQVIEFREQGAILDLSPILDPDLTFDPADFYPGVLEAFSAAGKTWALPSGVDPLVMYFNKDLFDAAGARYPQSGWTWDEFLSAALAVNDPDGDTFGYLSTPQSIDPLPFIFQHGGTILDDLQEPTCTTYDDPLTIDAVEWYADLVFEHNVIPTPEQQRRAFPGENGVYQGIFQGKVGMWVGALSERGGLTWRRQTWPMEWGVVPLPGDVQSMTLISAEGYFISSQTQHREACWQWIAFLGEQSPNRLAPARKSLIETDVYADAVGEEVAAAARDSLENAVMISPQLAAFGEVIEETFSPAIEAVLAEEAMPEEAMLKAQEQAENMIGP